jgi:uncharacterized membrane protein YhdT
MTEEANYVAPRVFQYLSVLCAPISVYNVIEIFVKIVFRYISLKESRKPDLS